MKLISWLKRHTHPLQLEVPVDVDAVLVIEPFSNNVFHVVENVED